jgi:hypothetical protein
MNTLIIAGVILLGVGLAAFVTWGVLQAVLDLIVLRRMREGDTEGVKRALDHSSVRISQRVRITAEVWLKDREGP